MTRPDGSKDEVRSDVARTFDKFSDEYAQTVNTAIAFTGNTVDTFTKVKAEYLQDLAMRHFGSIERLKVLDVGCGVGSMHPHLLGGFKNLTGADVSEASLKRAAAANKTVSYQFYDGSTLPFADGSFDCVFTTCVMHHVLPEQWPRFASQMFRVLKPEGLAVVLEHNPLNPLTRRAVDNCEFDEDAVLLWPSETRKLLREAGFRSVHSRTILSIPSLPGILRKVDMALGMLPFGAQYFVAASPGGQVLGRARR